MASPRRSSSTLLINDTGVGARLARLRLRVRNPHLILADPHPHPPPSPSTLTLTRTSPSTLTLALTLTLHPHQVLTARLPTSPPLWWGRGRPLRTSYPWLPSRLSSRSGHPQRLHRLQERSKQRAGRRPPNLGTCQCSGGDASIA